jgi:hypothetical protein
VKEFAVRRLIFTVLLTSLVSSAAAECRRCRPAPVKPKPTGGAVGLHPVQFWSAQWEKLEKRSAANPQAASLTAGVLAFAGFVAGAKAWGALQGFRRKLASTSPAANDPQNLSPH